MPRTLIEAAADITHSMQHSENEGRALHGRPLLPYSGKPASDREVWMVICGETPLDTSLWTVQYGWAEGLTNVVGWADDYEAVRSFERAVRSEAA